MSSPTFGVTQRWLEQFSKRLVVHTSFCGKAEEHLKPGASISKRRLHSKLMKAWFQMKILHRLAEIKGSRSLLSLRLVDHLLLNRLGPTLHQHYRSRRLRFAHTGEASLGTRSWTKFCLHNCRRTQTPRARWVLLSRKLLADPVHFVQTTMHMTARTVDDLLHVQVQRVGQEGFRVLRTAKEDWDAVQSTLIAVADAARRAANDRAVKAEGTGSSAIANEERPADAESSNQREPARTQGQMAASATAPTAPKPAEALAPAVATLGRAALAAQLMWPRTHCQTDTSMNL